MFQEEAERKAKFNDKVAILVCSSKGFDIAALVDDFSAQVGNIGASESPLSERCALLAEHTDNRLFLPNTSFRGISHSTTT